MSRYFRCSRFLTFLVVFKEQLAPMEIGYGNRIPLWMFGFVY